MAHPQAQVLYNGRVQGVGFRFTAVSLSRKYTVTGWVRNLPDGRVELLAEGPRTEVEKFLDALEEAFSRHIRGRHIDWRQGDGQYPDFTVRY